MSDWQPTVRQLQVIRAWGKHHTYRAAAGDLGLAEQTVKNVMADLRMRGRTNNAGLVQRWWPLIVKLDADPTISDRKLRYEIDSDYRERQRGIAREGMRRVRAALANKREEVYAQLSEDQDGLCAICHRPESAFMARSGRVKRLSIDHDHKTGQIRALLCRSCNIMLGTADDDPSRLEDAAAYLRKHAQSTSHNVRLVAV